MSARGACSAGGVGPWSSRNSGSTESSMPTAHSSGLYSWEEPSMRFSPVVVGAVLLQTLGSPSSAQELPEGLQPSFEEGVRALRVGKLDAAEAAFRRVLEQGGRVAYVHNNLGLVYQERGQHKPAVAQFREAIRLDPAYGAPRLALGASLLALDQVGEATVQLEQAAQLLPREPLARLPLAPAYERAGKWAVAVEQYRARKE